MHYFITGCTGAGKTSISLVVANRYNPLLPRGIVNLVHLDSMPIWRARIKTKVFGQVLEDREAYTNIRRRTVKEAISSVCEVPSIIEGAQIMAFPEATDLGVVMVMRPPDDLIVDQYMRRAAKKAAKRNVPYPADWLEGRRAWIDACIVEFHKDMEQFEGNPNVFVLEPVCSEMVLRKSMLRWRELLELQLMLN